VDISQIEIQFYLSVFLKKTH